MKRAVLILCCFQASLWPQEADSGFELRTTISGAAAFNSQLEAEPRSGAPVAGGFRVILYPTWKLNSHWSVSGAVQTHSRPYFSEEYSTQGYGARTDILQAHLDYTRFSKNRSIMLRFGHLSSAFGSFLLHYDDIDNPLIDAPLAYGYYYKPVSSYGLAGAQVDATWGKLDTRAQFTNSSPANRRSVFDRDQYGTWTGGLGYTIVQGLRAGVSAYRGPYLHREHAFFFPGEARPKELPATGFGVDAQWARGHWNVSGEWQHFNFDYKALPVFTQHTGYADVRRVLNPRLYVAARAGYLRANAFPGSEVYEFAAGLRPNRYQLLKIGYQAQHGLSIPNRHASSVTVQFVTAFRVLSITRD